MAEQSVQSILQTELERLETMTKQKAEAQVEVFGQAYQLLRTIEALFMYIAEYVPEDDYESAEQVMQALQENNILDEQVSAAVTELGEINQYLLDVENTDASFVSQIVDYAQTYMQAIKVVFERLQNTNSITPVEDNGKSKE